MIGHLSNKSVFSYIGSTQEVVAANKCVGDVINAVHNARNDPTVWDSIYGLAEKLSGQEITLPRIVGRQTNRSNIPAATPKQYYHRSLFLPYSDHLISELGRRFEESQTVTSGQHISLIVQQSQ